MDYVTKVTCVGQKHPAHAPRTAEFIDQTPEAGARRVQAAGWVETPEGMKCPWCAAKGL